MKSVKYYGFLYFFNDWVERAFWEEGDGWDYYPMSNHLNARKFNQIAGFYLKFAPDSLVDSRDSRKF